MATYTHAIRYTLDFEGGLSDNPNDSGGITNHGVSLAFASSTRNRKLFDKDGDGDIDREDIKLLTKEDAIEAFKQYFWDPVELDDIESEDKALLVFDANVNHGLGNSIPMIQRTCNKLGYNLVIDGKFGPKTKLALDGCSEESFCREFLNVRENFYHRIVEHRPSQKVFLRGWMNRINQLRKIVLN